MNFQRGINIRESLNIGKWHDAHYVNVEFITHILTGFNKPNERQKVTIYSSNFQFNNKKDINPYILILEKNARKHLRKFDSKGFKIKIIIEDQNHKIVKGYKELVKEIWKA